MKFKEARLDIVNGLKSIGVWGVMGLQEIRQRYRRSVLGPFWITVSTAILIFTMGPLYGKLFSQDLSTYFSYLAIGLIVWQTISSILNEAGNVFISAESFIKQVKLPYSTYVLKGLFKNLLIFAHNFSIGIVVLIIYNKNTWNIEVLAAPLGLIFIFINAYWITLLFGLLSARFRDMPMIISNSVQVIFFLTPIMWKRDMLGRHNWLADINPLYHLVEVVRTPLLGGGFPVSSFVYVGLMGALGNLLTFIVFSKYRSRISYWI